MTPERSHDRTVRLLEGRLDALARMSSHSLAGSRPFHCHLADAAAATRHAVELDLLSLEEADEIWAAVARRHPDPPWRPVAA